MEGIVEEMIEAEEKTSPSAQYRTSPHGDVLLISTHDQILGGDGGQIYLGCTFPADACLARGLHEPAVTVAGELATSGVVGRFGIDFVSTLADDGWQHYAIEINIRKGGTTHPFLTLKLLTDGTYDTTTGLYHSATGRPCYYVASDNVCDPKYRSITPEGLIAAAHRSGLHFDPVTERGAVFHLMGALPEFGKVGTVCIAQTRAGANRLFAHVVSMIERSCHPDRSERERAKWRDPRVVTRSHEIASRD
jgi:hypothetical protein